MTRRGSRPGAAGSTGGADAVLRLVDLSVSYGGVAALSKVNLQVRPGQLVGLIGPNGAGKTTLIDAVCGFTGYRGSVLLDGRPLEGLSAQQRSRAGISRTWQTADLFEELTVRENLALAGDPAGLWSLIGEFVRPSRRAAAFDRAGRVLDFLGIGEVADRAPDSLSQGKRKLVDVARAMVGDAPLLCLDEPAAGLDSTESAELGRQLREIVGTGRSMILVDHDMGLVLSVCDYVVVLDFGRVIAAGRPQQVQADPLVIDAYIGAEAGPPGTLP